MTTRVESLIGALATPAQSLEDTLLQLMIERGVDTAVGVQLDVLGRIVGQERGGLGDEDYRLLLRARIAANRSEGTVGDLLLVVRSALGLPAEPVVVHQQYPAAVVVRVLTQPLTDTEAALIAGLLRDAAAAGVRVILESSSAAPSPLFTWDTGPGWDTGVFLDANDGE